MGLEHSIDIAAPAPRVWTVLADVEAWPEFVPTVTSLEPLDVGGLRVGSRYRLEQPRLPENVWTVTEVVEGERFVWEASSPGVRIVAAHELAARSGAASLRLEVVQRGWLASTVGLLTRPMTRRYLAMEAEAMKQRVESRSSPAS